MTTVDKLIEAFPIQTLTKIVGVPTYQSIKIANDELSKNAATIPTTRGGGTLGHVGITVSPTIYATLSATPFNAPTTPTAPVLTGMTGPQIAAANRAFDKAKTEFAEHNLLQNALKRMLIAAIDPIYLKAINQPYVGLGNRTILELLDHLYLTYAKITPTDLKENDARMNAPYDPNQPFEFLIEQIQNAIDYAAHAGTPYSPEQTLATAYDLVFKTGMFSNDLRDWRRKPTAAKTWTNFKPFMTNRYTEWRQEHVNTAAHKYGMANAVHQDEPQFEQRTIDAIANLATATASDRAAVAKLTATIADLTTELKTTQAKLVAALETNARLAAAGAQTNKENVRTSNRERYTKPANRHYCWTHGYLCTHHSGKCPDAKPGHIESAKSRNTQGGSEVNKEEWIKIVTGQK